MRRPLIERVTQQRAGANDLTAIERFETFMNERFGNSLLLRLRAAGAIDVGPRAIMMSVEKQYARPEIDRGFELSGKIVIEAGHQQMLDPRVVVGA